jgi:hypothetical protein
MSKALKIAAVVVAVVAITVATAGVGTAPALSAASTTIAVGGTAFTTAGFAVAATGASLLGISAGTLLLASSALSLASGLTAKKPAIAATGAQTQFKADPNAGIPYVMGRTGEGGFIVFRSNADGWSDKTPNDLDDFVIVHSLGPIQGYESFTADQVSVTFDGSGNGSGAFGGFMWQTSQLGATPEAAALAVSAGSSTRPSGWGTDAKLSGLAASQWRLRFDAKGGHYQSGTPKPQWVLLGVKVYDPRLDSTYPGGSGACRSNDESTWVYSENPYLHALAWLIGRRQNGQRVMGVGLPLNGILISHFVEGANIADANGWKIGGTVYSTDNKWEVLKAILQAGAGEPLRLGAQVGCLVNTPRVSLATIGIDDLAQGEVSVTATQRQRDRINGVIPRYRSEDHQWEIVPGAPVRVAAHVTEDGEQRTREIEYSLVQVAAGADVVQPAQLARYDIENAREFGPISIPLKLRWMGYRPGDCVTANLPEDGLVSQPILILNRGLEPGSCVVTMTARSETAAKHPFALGQTTTAPPTPSVSGPPLVPTPASADWSITGTSITSGGVTVPALVIGGTAPTSIDTIVFEYRVYTGAGMDPEAGWAAAGLEPPQATAKTITTIASGTAYQVSIRYRARGTLGGRLILGPSTSGAYAGVTGGAGPAGLSNAIVYAYQRSSSGAPTLPSATTTYDFGTKALTGLNNGWSATVPTGTATLYITAATASANTSTDTIAAGEWASAQVWSSAGAPGDPGSPGLNSAPVILLQRNNTGTIPSAPSVTTTYTFATSALAGANNGWTQAMPDPSAGKYLFWTSATALSTGTTDTIAAGEWSTPKQFVKDGDPGAPGDPGDDGQDGFTTSPPSKAFSIACTSTGTPKSGEFNKVVTFKVLQGTTDISDDAATTYSLSNTNVNATMGGTNGKVFTATGMTADSGRSTVTVSRSGVAIAVVDLDFNKARDGSAASTGIDDTLSAMPNSTTLAQLGTFDILVGNGATLTMDANAAWFAATGSYPGRIAISYQNITDSGSEVFSSEAAGDITATTGEQAVASITGFTVLNSTGATKTFRVKVYGRRASGTGNSSGTTGYVSGSAS